MMPVWFLVLVIVYSGGATTSLKIPMPGRQECDAAAASYNTRDRSWEGYRATVRYDATCVMGLEKK